MEASVRKARPGDRERIPTLYGWLFADFGSVPPGWDPQRGRAALAEATGDPRGAVLIAEDEDELVGLCTARDWACERGDTHLELDSGEARVDAHRFYEREGPSWRSRCYAWEL